MKNIDIMIHRLLVGIVSAALLAGAGACSSHTPASVCISGETQGCACENGGIGVQFCAPGGTGYEPCACQPDDAGDPDPSYDAGVDDAGDYGGCSLARAWNEIERNGSCVGLWAQGSGSSSFEAAWECNGTPYSATLVITSDGSNVSVQRTDNSNGSQCSYSGSFSSDCNSLSGTYSCQGSNGDWSATAADSISLPSGSYANSCSDCAATSTNLICQCPDSSDNEYQTVLPLPCDSSDISNCEGALTCGSC